MYGDLFVKEGVRMIIIITGPSHTGKTVFAQKLLEKYKYPYLSIDHLKMGLIRSGNTDLTPCDDEELTAYLWPIVREMIKTAIENEQNLIVEGCYVPCDWKMDFTQEYLEQIKYYCLVMSKEYIEEHFADILIHANDIEKRLEDSDLTIEWMIEENENVLRMCKEWGNKYILINDKYEIEAKF